MNLRNYHPLQRAERTQSEIAFYRLDYPEGQGPYYAFECTPSGVVDLARLTDVQLQSWTYAHDPSRYRPGLVREVTYVNKVPAHGDCVCGRQVWLDDPLWNGCECGRWYNMSGQEVISPEQYDRDVYPETGESVFDVYNGRDDDW